MQLTGLFVPLVTPFAADGSVALDALDALTHHVLDGGATGIVALGTTGEPATLDAAERAAVVRVCSAVCTARGAPLLVGAGGNDTAATVDAVRALRGVCSAAMVVVPPYTRPGARGVLAHFARVAAASPVPIVVYHVPYRTGQPLDAATLLELAELPNVVGMKLADSAVGGATVELLAGLPAGFALLGGDDPVISPLLALGAAGGVLASAHLATRAYADLVHAWQAGDIVRARTVGPPLAALSRTLFAEPNPTVIKAVLHSQGLIPTPAVRLPLLPAGGTALETALATVARFRDSTVSGPA